MATYMRSRFFAWQSRLRSIFHRYDADRFHLSQQKTFSRIKPPENHRGSSSIKYPVLICAGLSSAVLVQTETNDQKDGEKEKQKDSPVINFFKMARLAQMKQDEEKAITYLHKALTAADDEFKHNRMSEKDYIYARINVFDSLANIALAKGEYTKAEKLFKETMKGCLEVGITKTDNAMVEMSIKLASIYAMQKREDEAVRGYEFCIETQNEKVKDPECDIDSLALLGIALESYGRYLLYHKNLEKSLVMLTRAVEVAKTTLGESGMQTLVLMNDLATVYILKKDFEKAEALLKQAIETGEKVESTHCPALYCNLGAVYLRKSQLSDTEMACKHGLQLAKKYKDKLAIEQAKICLNKVKEMKKKGF